MTESGGQYQCFKCSDKSYVTVNSESYHSDSTAIDSGLVVMGFILGFGGASVIIGLITFFMNRHYNPPVKTSPTPKKTLKEKIQAMIEESLEKPSKDSFKHYFINNHDFFSMTCLADPAENNISLNFRCFVNTFTVYIAVAFIFCGIDVANSVKKNTCSFDGTSGFTSSQTIYESSGQSSVELPTVNAKASFLVWVLNFFITGSIGYLKDKVFENMKTAEKDRKFKLFVFSLIIEITWVIILASCIGVEKSMTSTAQVPNKYSLYFQTVAVATAIDWFGWNNLKIFGKQALVKVMAKKYERVITSATSPV